MVNCWTFSTEGLSAAQGADLSGGAKEDTIRRLRRAMSKASQRPSENSIGLHSQNVAGFPKHPERCEEWFSHFRQRETRGVIDLVLLQETRVSIGEAARLNKFYSTTWGFVDKSGRTRWTESETARGRVAILLNPYSSITEMEPWHEIYWTPHWMAVQVTIRSEAVLVVNVYAPSGKTEKESFFEKLQNHLLEYDGPLHYSQALRRLLGQAQLCDVLEDDMERAEEERVISVFHVAAHKYFYTLPGDVDLSVPGPAADHNGISIRIVAPLHVVRVRKPWHVYPVPGCAQAAATSAIFAAIERAQIKVDESSSVQTSDYRTARQLADWWDEWKINIRKVLVATTKISRQNLTRSYIQRLKRLYVRLDAALLEARSSAKINTVCLNATTVFVERASSPVRIDDSNVTSVISPDDVCAALKRLKRGKTAGPDEINNTFYRDYADALAPILAALYTRWMECSVSPKSFSEANIQCLKKTAASALPLDHPPIALLNSDYKLFTKILSFRVRPMLSHIVLQAQVGFVPQRSIHTALDIFSAARKAASADSDLHGAIVLLLDFAKAYDTLQRPFLLSVLAWLGFSPLFVGVVAALHCNTTCRFLVNGYRSSRRNVCCGIRQGCPLAPLLFILALDSVYRVIKGRDDIHGIPLSSGGRTNEIEISGYADDTAVYLRDRPAVSPVVTILETLLLFPAC
ncbi:unnamed protein product [Peronospora effusa]|nr:unnamed protein product [Peronospora effusa]